LSEKGAPSPSDVRASFHKKCYSRTKVTEFRFSFEGRQIVNTYYSMLGRLLDERTPLKNEGYYILNRDNQVIYDIKPPIQGEIVTIESFTNVLVEGCKQILHSFADSPENKEVYAVSLYAGEHKNIYLYLNTLGRFNETLSKYQSSNQEYFERDRIISLKYNRGDFDFQFWQEHMGQYGKYITLFEQIGYVALDLDKDELTGMVDGDPVVAFEAAIIDNGYNVCALKAMQQLIAENAFDVLHKSDNFIAYASTGNDYVDYSMVMRKTIDKELFYHIFPDLKESDARFEEAMKQNMHLSLADSIAYWSEAIEEDYCMERLFTFNRFEMEVFVQLERFGNILAKECLEKLTGFARLDSIDMKNYKWVTFYIEALHFTGELTADQKEQCKKIAVRLAEVDRDLIDSAKELEALAGMGSVN